VGFFNNGPQGLNLINFDKSILVVAHPDDEILWFSSIFAKVAEIVICFLELDPNPSLSNGRKKALANYPLQSMSCLKVKESNVFNDENWSNPSASAYGLKVEGSRQCTRMYKKNYTTLKHALNVKLAGYEHVFTHSPWGEYGHEEHVQLFKVVKALQEDKKFSLWYPNYVSNKSYQLLFNHVENFDSQWVSYPTPQRLTQEIKLLYEQNGCWTWYKDWQWPNHDLFIKDEGGVGKQVKYGRLFPLNLVNVEVSVQKKSQTRPFTGFVPMKVMNRLKMLGERFQ